MEEKQKINCTVGSCIYNDASKKKCQLEEITVEPCVDCSTGETDESMCGNYEAFIEDDEEEKY